MNILIVDDSYEKVQIIAGGIKSAGLSSDVITHCSNSSDALKKMSEVKFDILFLDVQLPSALGESIEEDGGVNLLEMVGVHESINKPTHIVAITSHISSYEKHKTFFYEKGWVILCSELSKEIIKKIIVERLTTKNADLVNIDIVIITALEHTELQSVLEHPANWQIMMFPNDPSIYHVGEIILHQGLKKRILAVSAPRMGLVSSSAMTTKIQLKFNPDYIFMVGICAGVEGKTNLGDIIVADPVWDWGSGKSTKVDGVSSHLPSPHQISLDAKLRSKLMRLSMERKYLNEIYDNFILAKRPEHELQLIVGPMASGASVIEDVDIVKKIKSSNRDVIAVEMEAYGVMASVNIAAELPAKVIVIKSVCDFANLHKNNDWQKYAAYTSTAFTFNFIKNDLFV
ncbi:nucleoside phosphorylase [Serratia sp. FGI94]|uniref:phosphorylase family protein n=1 Tax=Serratia sp. FGI94 TaxID=671990 RepID=UPI0002A6FE22|nr:response regulator [Serratia sp. FGI94]AGB83649.1 nucleoside phosphorylase [Serratia sp. FGI94]